MDVKMPALAGSLVLLLTLGQVSSASPSPGRDLFAILAGTKISLDDAIQVAEKTVSGTTVKAELENDSHPNTYRVVIADSSSRTLTYLKIDSTTGAVLDLRTYRADAKAKSHKAKRG